MPFLKNLSSVEVFEGVPPWEWSPTSEPSEEVRTDKKLRDEWVNCPETDWNCYSLFTGVIPNLRLRSGSQEESNPPFEMAGLVCDYDSKTSSADIHAAIKIMDGPRPNWAEFTLSGNCRLIWLFERPLRFPSRKFAIEVLKKIDTIIPLSRLPGLDKPVLITPEKYWTNSGKWEALSRVLVPEAQLRGFILRISQRFDWLDKEFGKPAVSMERIAEELRKKYPRFSEWGEFSLGSQGPTFWVEGSKSPKSAIVKETGIFTFSGTAHKPFYSWSELVGAEFVDKSEDELLGKAVADIYYDGKSFFMQGPGRKILCNDPAVMRRHLVTMKGLSDKKPKDGGSSMVDKALGYIEHHQRVDGASSCAFFPHGVFTFNNNRILNTHRIEALPPVPESLRSEWGVKGRFPFLSEFIDQFFTPVELPVKQSDFFLAWLQLFYRSCLYREPRSGHGVVIAGPVNVGKTFLNRGVIGGLVGGSAEANAYLTGADPFNSELFDYGLWVVDDGSVNPNSTTQRLYTEAIKRIVANREHRVNEKYRKAVPTPWQGRIVITLNDDPVSIGNMPALDGSMIEKLMLFRAGPRQISFHSQASMEKILKEELPFFARWLLEWTPPAYVLINSDVRFGITAYCEPTLHRTSNLSSAVSSFAEILTRWLTEYFNEEGKGKTFWTGSAIDLRLSMAASPAFAEALRGYKPDAIPRMLLQLNDKKMFKMTVTETDNERHFWIKCEDRFLKKSAPSPSVPQAVNSDFQKK